MADIELYDEAHKKLGLELFNKLILTERALNQRHWAKGIRNALEPLKETQKTQPGQIKRVLSVVEKMEEQADEYDPPRET